MNERDAEEVRRILDDWTPPNQAQVPPILFRCRSLRFPGQREHVRLLVEERALTFADPGGFDDPFDCNPAVVSDRPPRREDVVDWLVGVAREDGRRGEELDEFVEENAAAIMRTGPGERRERNRSLSSDLRESLGKSGIVCFCADPFAPLVWSHYADGHRGVCLGYRTRPLTHEADRRMLPSTFIQVEYSTMRPTVVPFGQRDEPSIVAKKDVVWRHQQEWRLFVPPPLFYEFGLHLRRQDPTIDLSKEEYRCITGFPEDVLACVILGCEIEDQHAAEVRGWCEGVDVPVLEARQSESEFAIEIPGLDGVV